MNLVHAGETGGILDNIMNRLSVYLEKRQKLIRQVRGALIYPTIVFFIAVGVMTVLLTFVIPAFENMFKEFGGGKDNLPALTRMMVALSHGFVHYLPLVVLVAGRHSTSAHVPLQEPSRQALLPPHHPEASHHGPRAPEDRRRALHAHARHAAAVRRAHPRRARDLRARPPAT